MTIYNLRQVITVLEWSNDLVGGRIYYTMRGKEKTLNITYHRLLAELKAISAIESEIELLDGYEINQWDALNIVIRYEYAQYMESEIDNSDIGKAINKLKL